MISLTVVAFGTSAPELVVSLVSSIKGKSMIAVKNVAGGNMCNILSVFDAAEIVKPIPLPGSFFKSGLVVDYIVMMVISFFTLADDAKYMHRKTKKRCYPFDLLYGIYRFSDRKSLYGRHVGRLPVYRSFISPYTPESFSAFWP